MALPVIGISNQFKEDLKKIAELRPLVKDYHPVRKEGVSVQHEASMSRITSIIGHSRAFRRDFGRGMILPC